MAEGLLARLEDGGDVVRLLVGEELPKHVREDEDGLRDLPCHFVRGSVRTPIGAKKARKMCENESIRKTRSVGFSGFAFFFGGI